MLANLSITDFLNETASSSPAPGGGSISALAASLGAALTSMVCRLTIGKKKYAGVQPEIEEVVKRSEILRAQLTALIDEDTAAFNNVMAAFGMPKETDEQKAKRSAAIQEATKSATHIPLHLMELCAEAIVLTGVVAEKGNQNSLSDAGVAALMLHAGCEGAALNVKINLASLHDAAFVEAARKSCESLLAQVAEKTASIMKQVKSKIETAG